MKKITKIQSYSITTAILVSIYLLLHTTNAIATQNNTVSLHIATMPIPIVVSIAPQKYIIEKIGGDAVNVTVLVPSGADPHSFEPSTAQMRAFSNAALYFTIGMPFENIWIPNMPESQEKMDQSTDANIVSPAIIFMQSANWYRQYKQGHDNPHTWLAPLQIKAMLPIIVKALSELRPEQANDFAKAEKQFAAELDALHTKLTNLFAPIPKEQRVFITFHPSWFWFANEFNLEEISVEIDGKEPSPRQLKKILDTARLHSLHTLFSEPQFSRSSAQAVAKNIGANVEEIDPLAEDIQTNLLKTAQLLLDSFKR